MKKRDSHVAIGDEYEIVRLRPSWGALSLSLFLLALPAPYLLRWQPWRPAQVWMWPLVPVAAIAVLSLLGTAAGLLGVWLSPGRGLARVGLLLNAAILACVALVVLGMYLILS